MNFKFFCFLLYRYLFSSWAHKKKYKQGLPLATIIPVLGVAVGVFAFCVVLGVMSGFVTNMKSEIIKLTPHIQITSKNYGQDIPENTKILKTLEDLDPKAILDVTTYQSGDGILQADNQATLVTLEGVKPEQSHSILDLSPFLVLGSGLDTLDEMVSPHIDGHASSNLKFPAAVIGRELALQLNLTLGSVVTLVSVEFDEGIAPLQMPVVISGIYETGRMYFDNKVMYISLNTANRFFSSPNMWKGLQLKLKDPFHPEAILNKLNKFLEPDNLIAQDWTSKNGALMKALFLEHLGMIIVMTTIILVGCFSITISLLLSLHRKTRDLAILRGLGLTQKDLSKLYIGQGFCIGVFGVLIGLFLGLITLYIVHHYRIPFLSDAYSGGPLPVQINYFDLTFVSLGSIFLATFAAFWPAFEVRRLNVVDVLAIRQ